MINLVLIGSTDLRLVANQSSRTAQRVAELILQAFNYSIGEFHIAVEQPTNQP